MRSASVPGGSATPRTKSDGQNIIVTILTYHPYRTTVQALTTSVRRSNQRMAVTGLNQVRLQYLSLEYPRCA